MNAPHGALRMIELASVRMTEELGALIHSVEHQLATGDDDDLKRSARTLTMRLRLLLSATAPPQDSLGVTQLVELAKGLSHAIQLDHGALDPTARFEASSGRVLLNLLLVASSSLPNGGTIRLAGGTREVFIQIDGPDAAWPAGFAACLADPVEAQQALQARQPSQMALTAVLAHASGIRLSMMFSPNSGLYPPILRFGGS